LKKLIRSEEGFHTQAPALRRGNPVNNLVMQQIESTYYKINNVVGTTVINGALVVAGFLVFHCYMQG
jgi:hypothetical protein